MYIHKFEILKFKSILFYPLSMKERMKNLPTKRWRLKKFYFIFKIFWSIIKNSTPKKSTLIAFGLLYGFSTSRLVEFLTEGFLNFYSARRRILYSLHQCCTKNPNLKFNMRNFLLRSTCLTSMKVFLLLLFMRDKSLNPSMGVSWFRSIWAQHLLKRI